MKWKPKAPFGRVPSQQSATCSTWVCVLRAMGKRNRGRQVAIGLASLCEHLGESRALARGVVTCQTARRLVALNHWSLSRLRAMNLIRVSIDGLVENAVQIAARNRHPGRFPRGRRLLLSPPPRGFFENFRSCLDRRKQFPPL